MGSHTITPVNAACYLGIVVDRWLRWREHVEAAVAKGTAAMLAVGRLSRPTFGLPHQYARQLFVSIVCPKMEYGLPVWYTPVQRKAGAKRATGSVGIARRVGRVQRLAALTITGAFRTTATVFLDYHAGLLPVELRLNQAVHRATARLASLPADHPLYKSIHHCASHYPRFHRSPLHELFHAFPDLRRVTPSRFPPPTSPALGELPFEECVSDSMEGARAQANGVIKGRDLCVFVSAGVSHSKVGSAAVAATSDGGRVSRRVSLGPAELRQGHDGVLAAMTLGLSTIMGCPRVTRASLLVPDRKAVLMLTSQPDHPLSKLFLERLTTIRKRSRASLHLRIVWAPLRGAEHERVRWACDEAQHAAEGSESSDSELPRAVRHTLHSLCTERAVLEHRYRDAALARWQELWIQSPQGGRCTRVIDNSPPSLTVHKLYQGLPRRHCSILSQLRSGHAGLNAFLARINAVDSPLCQTCLVPETPSHFLFTCRRYTAPRDTMRRAVGGPLSLRSTVGDVKARAAVLTYVEATGRFTAYHAATG